MADLRDALRAKFGQPRPAEGTAVLVTPATRPRRRKRMTLRLSEDTAAGLRILKVVLGRDMNGICEEVLSTAVGERVAELEANAKPGEWDVIVRCANGGGG